MICANQSKLISQMVYSSSGSSSGRGGGQENRHCVSRASIYAAGIQGPLKGPGSCGVFEAQICIPPTF